MKRCLVWDPVFLLFAVGVISAAWAVVSRVDGKWQTYTPLNSPGSPLELVLVQNMDGRLPDDGANNDGHRGARGVDKTTTWHTHTIPYVIDPAYTVHGQDKVHQLKRAIQRIMDNVCVTFVDVTDVWNSSNSHWFTENGYHSDAYIWVKEHAGFCETNPGEGSGTSAMKTSPCLDFKTNHHEWLHTIGATHEQNSVFRDNYMTVNFDDILPGYLFTYRKNKARDVVDLAFDPQSTMMYVEEAWSRNGLSAYTRIREDIFESEQSSSEGLLFQELSQLFNCKEVFCNKSNTDCGLGYHSMVRGACRCICPPEFDPQTNCMELVSGVSDLKWPTTPLALFASGPNNSCPSEFNTQAGILSFEGSMKVNQALGTPYQIPFVGKTLHLPICTKDSPQSPATVDWDSWPVGGHYCVIKPKGVNCGGPFQEATVYVQSQTDLIHNGSLGDMDIDGKDVTMKLCCKASEVADMVVPLPDKEPFKLISGTRCPIVRGMRDYAEYLYFQTNVKNISGNLKPLHWNYSHQLILSQCYYQPPVYGCNLVINLSRTNRSTTVVTPGFGSSREPNRRCIYHFQVADDSQIRITFNTYDLHKSDYVLVKRYHKWQEPHRIPNDKWPAQFVSEKDFLIMEFWSSWETSQSQGLNFTADVLLPEDSCYNMTLKGDDYFGNTSFTETYEDCLPWSDAVQCVDFPISGLLPVWMLLSDNKCRNPAGELSQPWCYTYRNGTNCYKRYCDVCNTQQPVDLIPDCASLKKLIPDFCNSSLEKLGCFRTCGFQQQPTERSTCGTPPLPPDGVLVGAPRSIYKEGEKLTVQCRRHSYGPGAAAREMMCTRSGWTELATACEECPPGWLQHGGRCIYLSSDKTNVRAAEKSCQNLGANGTLFQVLSSEDLLALRDYRDQMGLTGSAWIGGEFLNSTKQWTFTNSNLQMQYFNWSYKYVNQTSDSAHNCIRLIAEVFSDRGGWHPVKCDVATDQYTYVCQLPVPDVNCTDLVSTSTCEHLLSVYPEFCLEKKLKNVASSVCSKSCGRCVDTSNFVNSSCSFNDTISVKRSSSVNPISAGQVMNFSCQSGFYHQSGQLIRACSTSGILLGTEAVCVAHPLARDVKLKTVWKRRSTLSSNRAVIFNNTDYSVPFKGKIDRWYYHCQKSGLIHFLVYRPTPDSQDLTYLASNNVTCLPDRPRTFYVPQEHQIHVLAQDAVGVYATSSDTLSVNNCTSHQDHLSLVVQKNADSLAKLITSNSSSKACFFASFGYHVIPGENKSACWRFLLNV